jgi:glutathione peroxidase
MVQVMARGSLRCNAAKEATLASIYDFTMPLPNGAEISLSDHRGRVVLIVNTASRCGFTPQYAGLEKLHRQFGSEGLSVLGFPCNQFGGQEPGGAEEIEQFCSANFGVTFPLGAKIEVRGEGAHPLFRFLSTERRGLFGTRSIKWNFTKFLVDREGSVVARYGPRTKPDALEGPIRRLL